MTKPRDSTRRVEPRRTLSFKAFLLCCFSVFFFFKLCIFSLQNFGKYQNCVGGITNGLRGECEPLPAYYAALAGRPFVAMPKNICSLSSSIS